MTDFNCLHVQYMLEPGSLPFICSFLLRLAVVTDILATFGVFLPEFIQAGQDLLGHFSAPAPTLFPFLLPLLLFLLLLKISVAAPLNVSFASGSASHLLSA